MKAKLSEQKAAIRMRKDGVTIHAIAQKLKVSKASVSLWLRGVTLPPKALSILNKRAVRSRKMASEAKKKVTSDRLHLASLEATTLLNGHKIDSQTALISCALMYWCEGSKSKNDSEFTFTNSDPMTIRGFLSLLRKAFPSLDEQRFRVKMHLHAYHSESTQKKFWSNITGIPVGQFQGTYWKNSTGHTTKDGYPGCIHVRYHDVRVARKISAVARNFLTRLDMIQ